MSRTAFDRKILLVGAALLLVAVVGGAAGCAPRALRIEADRPRGGRAEFDDPDLRLTVVLGSVGLDAGRLHLRIDNHRADAVEVRWEEAAWIGPDHRLSSVVILPPPGPVPGGASIDVDLGPLALPEDPSRWNRRRAELTLPVIVGGVRREYHLPLRLRF